METVCRQQSQKNYKPSPSGKLEGLPQGQQSCSRPIKRIEFILAREKHTLGDGP